jgi:hypothetical protein
MWLYWRLSRANVPQFGGVRAVVMIVIARVGDHLFAARVRTVLHFSSHKCRSSREEAINLELRALY